MREDTEDRTADIRAVWQSDSTELRRVSLPELERVARGGRRLHAGTFGIWAICAIEIVVFTVFFFQPGDALRKAGALLTVAGMAFLATQLRYHYVRMRRYQEAMVAEPSVVFYRAWLEQLRSFSRGRWFWSRLFALMPGLSLFSFDIGRTAADGLAGYTLFFVFVGLFAAAIVLNVIVSVRVLNRRLVRLEAFADDE